jgi:hypothetical protein
VHLRANLSFGQTVSVAIEIVVVWVAHVVFSFSI